MLAFFAGAQTETAADEEVVIITGDTPADQAAAEALAAKLDAELLVVHWGTFSQDVINDLKESPPDKVVIIGGDVVIPGVADAQIAAIEGVDVDRLTGEDRYQTSAEIAHYGWGEDGASKAYVIDGYDDASIEDWKAKAAAETVPILYTRHDGVSDEVKSILEDEIKPEQIEVVYSPNADQDVLKEELSGVEWEVVEQQPDFEERAKEMAKAVEFGIATLKNELSKSYLSSEDVAATKLYEEMLVHTENMKAALDAGDWGKAFGLANSARYLGINTERKLDGIDVPHLDDDYAKYKGEYESEAKDKYGGDYEKYKSEFFSNMEKEHERIGVPYTVSKEDVEKYAKEGHYIPAEIRQGYGVYEGSQFVIPSGEDGFVRSEYEAGKGFVGGEGYKPGDGYIPPVMAAGPHGGSYYVGSNPAGYTMPAGGSMSDMEKAAAAGAGAYMPPMGSAGAGEYQMPEGYTPPSGGDMGGGAGGEGGGYEMPGGGGMEGGMEGGGMEGGGMEGGYPSPTGAIVAQNGPKDKKCLLSIVGCLLD